MYQCQLNSIHSTTIFLHTNTTHTSTSNQTLFICSLLQKHLSKFHQLATSELQAAPSESDTMNLPPIQTNKHLMPQKAFKLLYSKNFISKLPNHLKPAQEETNNKTKSAFCQPRNSVSQPTATPRDYQSCKQTSIKPSTIFTTTCQTPRFFSYLLLSLQQPKNQTDTIFLKIDHPYFKASLSKPHFVSIYKTPMTIPLNKQHSPHRTPNSKQ